MNTDVGNLIFSKHFVIGKGVSGRSEDDRLVGERIHLLKL